MAITIGQQYEGIASWATPKAREFDDNSNDYLMIAAADLPTLGLFDSDTPFTILATWYAGAFDDDHTLVGLWGGSLSNRLVWPRGQSGGEFKTFYDGSSQGSFGTYTTDTWYTAGLFCDGTGNGNGGSGSANFRTIVHNHATGEIVGDDSFSASNADSDLREEADLKLATYGSDNDPFTGALFMACCFVGIELTASDLARFRVDPYAVISQYRAYCAWSPAPGELLGSAIADGAPCPNIVPSSLGMEFEHHFRSSPSFTTTVAPSRPPEPYAIVVQSITAADVLIECSASVTILAESRIENRDEISAAGQTTPRGQAAPEAARQPAAQGSAAPRGGLLPGIGRHTTAGGQAALRGSCGVYVAVEVDVAAEGQAAPRGEALIERLLETVTRSSTAASARCALSIDRNIACEGSATARSRALVLKGFDFVGMAEKWTVPATGRTWSIPPGGAGWNLPKE